MKLPFELRSEISIAAITLSCPSVEIFEETLSRFGASSNTQGLFASYNVTIQYQNVAVTIELTPPEEAKTTKSWLQAFL